MKIKHILFYTIKWKPQYSLNTIQRPKLIIETVIIYVLTRIHTSHACSYTRIIKRHAQVEKRTSIAVFGKNGTPQQVIDPFLQS